MKAVECPECNRFMFSASYREGEEINCQYCDNVFLFKKEYEWGIMEAEEELKKRRFSDGR